MAGLLLRAGSRFSQKARKAQEPFGLHQIPTILKSHIQTALFCRKTFAYHVVTIQSQENLCENLPMRKRRAADSGSAALCLTL
jgi:hypothetical protein